MDYVQEITAILLYLVCFYILVWKKRRCYKRQRCTPGSTNMLVALSLYVQRKAMYGTKWVRNVHMPADAFS